MKYLIALLAGLAMPFAFAPYGIWPLAFVSIAVLFRLVLSESEAQQSVRPQSRPKVQPRLQPRLQSSLLLGLVYGLGYFALGVYWIYFSIRLFGDAVAPLAFAMTALFVLVLAVFPALSCALFGWLRGAGQNAVFSALLFSSCWLGFELLRGWFFGGFPWLLLGYSQIDALFSSYAPVFGVFAISWTVVFLACCLSLLLVEKQRAQRVIIAVILVAFTLSAAALTPVLWTRDKSEAVALRLVQGNIKQELKFSRERLRESLETYQRLSLSAPSGTRFVIWPETAIPTLFSNVDEALQPFIAEMSAKGVDVLSGGFHRDEQQRTYNSFRQLGGERALYSKGHLVPFGEFMPFRFLLEPIANFVQIPMSDLSAAPQPAKTLRLDELELGVSICFEDVFGAEMRSTLPAASMLINVSNDAWFGDTSAPHQHQEMARMRAREFERAMVRVTNTGISSTISFTGVVEQSIPFAEQGVLDADIKLREGATPYVTLGNVPVWILTALSLLAGLLLRRRNLHN